MSSTAAVSGPATPPGRLAPFAFALRVAGLCAAFWAVLWVADAQLVPRFPEVALEVMPDLPNELPALARAEDRVLFLGDSVVHTVARRDDDRRTLAEMVADQSGLPVVDASRAASAIDRYRLSLRWVARRGLAPRVAVVPINPRSFAPSWTRNPGWRFRRNNAMLLAPLRTRFLAAFGYDFEPLTDADWRATPVVVDGERVGTVESLMEPDSGLRPSPEGVRGRYLVRYAADVEGSPRMADLRALVDWARTRAPFPVLFVVSAVDVETAEQVLGEDTFPAVADNLRRIGAVLERAGVPFVDLSRALPAARFDHPRSEPHEHLDAAGRAQAAAAIADALKRMLGGGGGG